jgi:chaperone required for assembly of F1-ATPase
VKRFWKSVSVETEAEGCRIELDGRPIKTPARALLVLPTIALAEAIADEWRAVEQKVDPRRMPLTGLSNAALDRIAPDPKAFAEGLARYAEADLACYRAEGPRELVSTQEEEWDKLLCWARRRFDIDFETTTGLKHVAQPPSTIEQLRHYVTTLGAFQLAGLSPLVTIGGSLVAAIGVVEKAFSADEAWTSVSVDERWQLQQWGSDLEAEAALENRRRDFFAAARFLELLD